MVKKSLALYAFELYVAFFVFVVVNWISGDSRIAFVLFSIKLITGVVLNFKGMDRSIYDKNDKNDF